MNLMHGLFALAIFGLSGLPALAEQSPADAYKEIHRRELAANSYEDLLKVRSSRSIAKDPPQSKEEIQQMFVLLKMMMPKEVTIIGQESKGSEATVRAVASPAPGEDPSTKTTGVITLVLENGVWKVDREKWDSKLEKQ